MDVYFQKCAWADTTFCCEWVGRTLKPAVDERFVRFCGNLAGQISDDFKKVVSDIGGICWYGVNPISGGGLRVAYSGWGWGGGGGGDFHNIHNNGRGGDVTYLDYKVILDLPNYVIYFALTSLFC